MLRCENERAVFLLKFGQVDNLFHYFFNFSLPFTVFNKACCSRPWLQQTVKVCDGVMLPEWMQWSQTCNPVPLAYQNELQKAHLSHGHCVAALPLPNAQRNGERLFMLLCAFCFAFLIRFPDTQTFTPMVHCAVGKLLSVLHTAVVLQFFGKFWAHNTKNGRRKQTRNLPGPVRLLSPHRTPNPVRATRAGRDS